jgi:broad specificity phosphatase PhoE
VTDSDFRVVLLRHGETEWAAAGKHTGRTDIPLTTLGEEQAAGAGELIGELGLRNPLVVSSPRARAVRTAELAGLTIDRTWDALSEWNYGDYEGRTSAEIRREVPHWTVWTHPCPGGETVDEVGARADLVLQVVVPTLTTRDVVLVGHGHFSRALVSRWAQLPVTEGRRFALSPAAHTVLGYEHGFQQIVVHNVHPSVRGHNVHPSVRVHNVHP